MSTSQSLDPHLGAFIEKIHYTDIDPGGAPEKKGFAGDIASFRRVRTLL
jgi:hypothetical protein